MTGGFSFCGVDIAKLGLEYAPEMSDTYVYGPGEETIHDESFEGHNGGYFYGVYKKPKVMNLRVFFEETHMNNGVMSRVFALFKKGKQGKLIFKKRPWCYYICAVTDCVFEPSNYLNGIIKITMTAYYPYARSDRMYCTPNNSMYKVISNNTAMPPDKTWVPAVNTCRVEDPILLEAGESKYVYLLNPGTEMAALGIRFRSHTTAAGFTVTNETTNETCKFVSLRATTPDDVFFDGLSGKTILLDKDTEEHPTINMLFHDSGSIRLAPAGPCMRPHIISFEQPGTYVESGVTYEQTGTVQLQERIVDSTYDETIKSVQDQYIGKYIYVEESWYPIIGIQDTNTLIIGNAIPSNATYEEVDPVPGGDEDELEPVPRDDELETPPYLSVNTRGSTLTDDVDPGPGDPDFIPGVETMIVVLNKLVVTAIDTLRLNKLNFKYKATFS